MAQRQGTEPPPPPPPLTITTGARGPWKLKRLEGADPPLQGCGQKGSGVCMCATVCASVRGGGVGERAGQT